jgi:hypothetical protein
MKLPGNVLALSAITSILWSSGAESQLLASEPASLTQTVDGTKIAVVYHRPIARGRTGLFGKQVHWGEVWTPGANVATTLAVSKDVMIDGTPVPKGKYSVWITVGRDDWEMLLDGDTTRFHTQRPGKRPGQIRFRVTREKRPFMETLTWWVPEVRGTSLTLAMQWDTVFVPLHIKVPPSFSTAVASDEARRVVGTYQLHFQPMPTPPGGEDSTSKSEREAPPTDVTLTIRHEGGELRAVMDPPMWKSEPGYKDWIFLPRKGGLYAMGRFDGGELIEVMDYFSVQFVPEGTRAEAFEIRLPNDILIGKGKRVP